MYCRCGLIGEAAPHFRTRLIITPALWDDDNGPEFRMLSSASQELLTWDWCHNGTDARWQNIYLSRSVEAMRQILNRGGEKGSDWSDVMFPYEMRKWFKMCITRNWIFPNKIGIFRAGIRLNFPGYDFSHPHFHFFYRQENMNLCGGPKNQKRKTDSCRIENPIGQSNPFQSNASIQSNY